LLTLLLLSFALAACTQQRASEPKAETPPRQEDAGAAQNQDPAAKENADQQRARERGQKVGEKARAASEKVREETKDLAAKAKAAAQGIQEGWNTRGNVVNVNTASAEDLETQLGLTPQEASRVMAGRPYQTRGDVQRVLPAEKYQSIANRITVK
jgi:DNA uptake protein ComE-like DNA-binding protein